MVMMLARPMRTVGRAAIFAHRIFAQHHVRFQRFKRVDENRKLFIFDLNRFNPVRCRVTVLGHNKGHFLSLEQHLAIGQHHLLVTCQRWHPVQAQRLQFLGRQNGENSGHFHSCGRVDADDLCVRIWRAHKVAKKHPIQLDIIDIIALALGETCIFHPFARTSQTFEVLNALFAACYFVFHSAASLAAFISAAAA